MLWTLAVAPGGDGHEWTVRCVTTGGEGRARLTPDRTRFDGPVRSIIVDAEGGRWHVVVDRTPELDTSARSSGQMPTNCDAGT